MVQKRLKTSFGKILVSFKAIQCLLSEAESLAKCVRYHGEPEAEGLRKMVIFRKFSIFSKVSQMMGNGSKPPQNIIWHDFNEFQGHSVSPKRGRRPRQLCEVPWGAGGLRKMVIFRFIYIFSKVSQMMENGSKPPQNIIWDDFNEFQGHSIHQRKSGRGFTFITGRWVY